MAITAATKLFPTPVCAAVTGTGSGLLDEPENVFVPGLFRREPRWIEPVQRIVTHVRVGVLIENCEGVGREEMPRAGVIHPPAHVDEPQLVVVAVAGESMPDVLEWAGRWIALDIDAPAEGLVIAADRRNTLCRDDIDAAQCIAVQVFDLALLLRCIVHDLRNRAVAPGHHEHVDYAGLRFT
jgi:hypothetical protein